MVDITVVLCHGGTSLQCFKGSNKLGTFKVLDPLSSVQCLAPNYLVGAASTKPLLYVWNMGQDSSVMKYVLPGIASHTACSPCGLYVVASTDNIMRVWHLPSGALVTTVTVHYQKISCLTFSQDTQYLVSGGEDNVVYVWCFAKLISGHGTLPLHSFPHHSMPVQSLYCGYGGAKARLFTAGLDNSCNIYDLCTGSLLLSLTLPSPITQLLVDPSETSLYSLTVSNKIYKVSLTDRVEDNLATTLTPLINSVCKLSVMSLSGAVLLVGNSNGGVVQYYVVSGHALPEPVCQHQELVRDIVSVRCSEYTRSVKHVPFPYQCVLQRREGLEVEESGVMLGRRRGERKGERKGDAEWLELVRGCSEEEGLSNQKDNLHRMECLSAKLLEVVTNKVLSDV